MVGAGIWNSKLFLSLTLVLGLTIIGFPSASAQITNGGFETGDFTGWTLPAGSTPSVVSSFGAITPTEGGFMALLTSSGLGVPTPPGTFGEIVSQPFTIPPSSGTLDFCYQFFTDEVTPTFFDDFFLAELSTTSGPFTIGSADTNGSPAGGSSAPPPPSISAGVTLTPTSSGFSPSSTIFSEETALVCSSFVIPSSIKGTTATIKFTIGDLFDTVVDSGVLIDCVGFDGSCATPTSTGGGGPAEPPTIGTSMDGIVKHNNGICINITCWDVTQNYHVDFELYEMLTGTNTISLTIWCPHGVTTCNYVGLGITPPNERPSSTIWSIVIEKDSSGEWKLTKDDSEGRLGNITFTVQEVGTQFLTVSFTIDFKNLSTDKMWLWVELRDTNRGVNLFFFNDGVKFIDIDAYPEVQTAFEPSLKLEPLCLNEDSTYRYSCAFAENRDQATQLAEETLRQIMNNEYTYK